MSELNQSTVITAKYPDCYLHVEECRSGEEFIREIKGDETLDLNKQIALWLKEQYCGELELDGDIMPRLQGNYYARIMTDSRPPESAVCWTSGGFYLKPTS